MRKDAKDSKIKRICRLEGIDLKEFANLTGLPYGTVKNYSSGHSDISLPRINDICAVPRFAQYRNMLLSLDEPISEGPAIRDPAATYTTNKTAKLMDDLEKAGLGEQARDMLQILLDAANAKTNK